MQQTSITISDQINEKEDITYGGYRKFVLKNILENAINERFSTITNAPNAPFLGASTGSTRLNRSEISDILAAQLDEANIHTGIQALFEEMERIKQFGLTAGELQRAKDESLSFYNQYYQGRHNFPSSTKAEELIRAFENGEPVPGALKETELAQYYIEKISQEEVKTYLKDWMSRGSLLVQLIMPENERTLPPKTEEIQTIIATASETELKAPTEEPNLDRPLIEDVRPAGTIVERSFFKDLNLHKWTLSNGVEVFIKPTEFKQDEVLFGAYSLGGQSTVSDEDFLASTTSVSFKMRSGLGSFNASDIEKKLAGINVGLSNGINRFYEEFSGEATPEFLRELLVLTYLNMQEPRFEPYALKTFIRDTVAQIKNRESSPSHKIQQTFNQMLWNPSVRSEPWTMEDLEKLDLKRSEELYRKKFGNAADFRFFFVGKIDLLEAEIWIRKYLASLPSSEEREEIQADSLTPKKGEHKKTIRIGADPKALVIHVWHGPFPELSWTSRSRAIALESILSSRLLKVLREDLGGVYNVSVNTSFQSELEKRYKLQISFVCDPNRVEELQAALQKELEKIQTELVTPEEIYKEQEQTRRSREELDASNAFWLAVIMGVMKRGETLDELLMWEERNNSLNATEIQKMAKRLLENPESHVEFVQLPEIPDAEP